MNKTITINLGGIVFHIDENAYEQLKKYLERLKLHFNTTTGKDEIIADIENRIAEMFTEKVSDSKQVITVEDVTAVITTMGNPEEMTDNEQPSAPQSSSSTASINEKTRRRFYRNPDDKILGGVCGGIGAYFDIDPVWFRLAFVISVFFAGTGILVYIVLWIIIPPARTTSEKLEMKGEQVTVSNIEKNVREELENVKQRLEEFGKEISSEQTRQRVRSTVSRTGNFISELFRILFKFISIIFGTIITIISLVALVVLSLALFTVIGVFSIIVPLSVTHLVMTQWELISIVGGFILLIGIPFTILLLNGLKILFSLNINLKKTAGIMLIFWLIGLGICVIGGIAVGKEYSKSAIISQKVNLGKADKVIHLQLSPSRDEWREAGDEYHFFDESFYIDNKKANSIFVNGVDLNITKSENDSASLIINYVSRGRTFSNAWQLAHAIQYNYSISDSGLKLSPAFSMGEEQTYRGQHIRMTLKLPLGKIISFSKDMNMITRDVQIAPNPDNNANYWDLSGHQWKMTADGLQCVDCNSSGVTQPQTSYHHHKFRIAVSRI